MKTDLLDAVDAALAGELDRTHERATWLEEIVASGPMPTNKSPRMRALCSAFVFSSAGSGGLLQQRTNIEKRLLLVEER